MANEQDKDNDMQENKKDKSRKSAIITGVICVLLCIIGALYIWHKQTQKPPVQLDVNSHIIGFVVLKMQYLCGCVKFYLLIC